MNSPSNVTLVSHKNLRKLLDERGGKEREHRRGGE
jgi:hypothetical protein